MPDKGKAMSQTYHEKENKLLQLYQESFVRKEMNVNEAATALKMMGFSESIAASRVRDWAAHVTTEEPETGKAKRHRHTQRVSLEKYILRIRLGKKYYDAYMKLQLKYKNKELSRDRTVAKLIQSGYSRKYAERTVDKWEAEK